MKKIIVAVWILLLFLAAVFYWFAMPWLLPDKPTIIEGFSAEVKTLLEQHYGVRIPEDARFISGCYTNSWRDPHIAIQFELDVSGKTKVDQELHDLILTDGIWSDSSSSPLDLNRTVANDIFGYDVIYTREFTCKAKEFTSLFYNIAENGVVQCCFCAPYPDDKPVNAPSDSVGEQESAQGCKKAKKEKMR